MGIRREPDHCDASWNVVLGCTPVSPGCDHCLAANAVYRFSRHPDRRIAVPMVGLTTPEGRGTWTGIVACQRTKLSEPLDWQKSRRVAVAPMGDLFHESVPDDFLLDVFRVMHKARHHIYQVLTKRPERMLEFSRKLCWDERKDEPYLARHGGRPYLPLFPHIWCGASIENQESAVKRTTVLLQVGCAVRFLSVEPIIGPVDLLSVGPLQWDVLHGWKPAHDGYPEGANTERISWVIGSGESGPNARVCQVEWLESLRDQCQAAGVAYWCKQLGTRPARGSILLTSSSYAGDRLDDLPASLRVREFPNVQV